MLEKERNMIRKRDKRVTVSWAMSDTPLGVHNEFTKDIHLYNDIYWVKLKELMLKARAFDSMMGQSEQQAEVEEPKEEPEEKEEVILTMGGPVRAGKKMEEKDGNI